MREAIVHLLAAQDFSSAVLLMERAAEAFWLQGESQLLSHWVMALPDATLRKHARFALTAAFYLLNASFHSTGAQAKRARVQGERMMARVEETTLLTGKWEMKEQLRENQELPAPEMALLRRRLRLLRLWSTVNQAEIHHDWEEQFLSSDQQLQREDQDDEMLWQMIPLSTAFLAHFTIRDEGALLLPRLLAEKQQASQSGDRFVLINIKKWLALTAFDAGRLRLAQQECLQALSLLEQWGGYDALSGYFSLCLAGIFYEWNRLEEARDLLRKTIHDATSWQQVDLQTWGSLELADLEMSAGNLIAADQLLQEMKPQLHHATPFLRSVAVSLRVQWWLAQGNLAEASTWAARSAFRQDVTEPATTEL